MRSYACGGTQRHTNNVVHSCAVYGFIVIGGDKDGAGCTEVGYLYGYKNRKATAIMNGGTGAKTNYIHNVISVDSGYGIMGLGADKGHLAVEDSIIYGGSKDMENLDCLNGYGVRCGACNARFGVLIPTFSNSHTTSAAFSPV